MPITIDGNGIITGAATLATTVANPTFTTPNINSAQFATVSGTAPIYACRAWVNFNGTGTVAIRASGNVSSITDNGTGNYTVNFTNAMPDANYLCNLGFPSFAVGDIALNAAVRGTLAGGPNNKTTSAISIITGRAFSASLDDLVDVYVTIFR